VNAESLPITGQVVSKTEDRILMNALKHFCDFGYTGTSVRDITAASEVTKPTLYYYFKNKEELYIKLASSCFDLVVNKIKSILHQDLTLEQGVNALFDAYEQVLTEQPDALKFIYSISVSPQRGSPEVGVQRFNQEVETYISSLIDKAVNAGECLASKAETFSVLLNALFAYHSTCLLMSLNTRASSKTRAIVSNICTCAKNAACAAAEARQGQNFKS
jgi:AcrR family transcriptional regulator